MYVKWFLGAVVCWTPSGGPESSLSLELSGGHCEALDSSGARNQNMFTDANPFDAKDEDFLTIMHATGSKPLELWQEIGRVRRSQDSETKSLVVSIVSKMPAYIRCPKGPKQEINSHLRVLGLIVREVEGSNFGFEVTVVDSSGTQRRLRAATHQKKVKLSTDGVSVPLELEPGWNLIAFDCGTLCFKAFKQKFVAVKSLKINANCHLRRVFLARNNFDSGDDIPIDFAFAGL